MTAPQFVALLTYAPRVIAGALLLGALIGAYQLGRWM